MTFFSWHILLALLTMYNCRRNQLQDKFFTIQNILSLYSSIDSPFPVLCGRVCLCCLPKSLCLGIISWWSCRNNGNLMRQCLLQGSLMIWPLKRFMTFFLGSQIVFSHFVSSHCITDFVSVLLYELSILQYFCSCDASIMRPP